MVGLWLDTKNHKESFYIKQKSVLNDRLQSIKPPSVIKRRPRSLVEKENFKANEWRSFLLYYSRYSLVGILETRYIEHFHLLSSAIYILSKKKILVDEIDQAEEMLLKYADDFETLYGPHYVTMNIHLLRHLANAVRHLGPLWAQSMFAFEQMNGLLVSLVNGNTDVLHQITEKYILRKTLQPRRQFINNLILKRPRKNFEPNADAKVLLSQCNIPTNEYTAYFTSIERNGELFTSTAHKELKSNDNFVMLTNGEMGKILYFIHCNEETYALVQIFITVGNKNHLHEVISEQSMLVIKIEEIQEKLIYMKFGTKQIVCAFPNRYEKT